MMQPFLKSIAEAYLNRNADISKVCFVFPNKRSGTFFVDHIQKIMVERGVRQCLLPEISTISDFVESLSGRVVNSRVDSLLLLYDVYVKYLKSHAGATDVLTVAHGKKKSTDELVDFDNFRIWGEMVLSDFNDVEMYLVDTHQLFKNLHDHREIQSTYLDENQIKVMRDYFGVNNYATHRTNFWEHYNNPDSEKSKSKSKFFKLWEILEPLYNEYCKSLDAQGLTFSGRAYRLAYERIKAERGDVLPYDKVVFVGFNALSMVEWSIFNLFKNIKKNGSRMGEFLWDYNEAVMGSAHNSAGHFVKKNIENFPPPADISLEASRVSGLGADMEVISAPSAVAQVKIITKILEDLYKKLGAEKFNEGKVAVVLPEESMLIPLLYSLPDSFGGSKMADDDTPVGGVAVNITMGYSMKYTAAASFVNMFHSLQRRKRQRQERWEFMREDVITVLSHPFTRIILGADMAAEMRRKVNNIPRIMLDSAMMREYGEIPARLFRVLLDYEKGDEALKYVRYIMDLAIDRVGTHYESVGSKNNLEVTHLQLYRRALERLEESMEKYSVRANALSVFSLLDKLLAGETIVFEGEPLSGLQVMGPLETRCLDFDYLIIPSMNERIYPRKMRSRTFIPNALRYGYGMATSRFQESIFSYNFYRMISRAKGVYMIYDARSEGVRSGDVSRYVMQLNMLYARNRVKFSRYGFSLNAMRTPTVTLEKKDAIMDNLELFFTQEGRRKYFSASGLNQYVQCRLAFCLQRVMGIREEDDPTDFLSPSDVGTIVHDVLAHIYTPEGTGTFLSAPKEIDESYLKKWIDGTKDLDKLIRNCVCREKVWLDGKDHETPETLPDGLHMYMNNIRTTVVRMLKHDVELISRHGNIYYYGSEIKETYSLKLPDGSVANMTYIIDRLDKVGGETAPFRIVDYKTGAFNVKMPSVEEVFANRDLHVALQLMLYAMLFGMKHRLAEDEEIILEIYDLLATDISGFKENRLALKNSNRYYAVDYNDVRDEFEEFLMKMLCEIHSADVPFSQAAIGEGACDYCPFKDYLCFR